jgi:hypothetical protein
MEGGDDDQVDKAFGMSEDKLFSKEWLMNRLFLFVCLVSGILLIGIVLAVKLLGNFFFFFFF